jgi:hypothetical protein
MVTVHAGFGSVIRFIPSSYNSDGFISEGDDSSWFRKDFEAGGCKFTLRVKVDSGGYHPENIELLAANGSIIIVELPVKVGSQKAVDYTPNS